MSTWFYVFSTWHMSPLMFDFAFGHIFCVAIFYYLYTSLPFHSMNQMKAKQSKWKASNELQSSVGIETERTRTVQNTKQMKKKLRFITYKMYRGQSFHFIPMHKTRKNRREVNKKKHELQYVAHENAIWFYLIQFVYPLYQLCICPFSNTIKWNWWKSEMFKSFSLFAIANQSKEWIDCFYLSFTILSLQFHYHEGWQYKVDSMKIATFQLTANLLNVLL